MSYNPNNICPPPTPAIALLSQIQKPIDIFLSHDWPCNIARYGNTKDLIRRKQFLAAEVGSCGIILVNCSAVAMSCIVCQATCDGLFDVHPNQFCLYSLYTAELVMTCVQYSLWWPC